MAIAARSAFTFDLLTPSVALVVNQSRLNLERVLRTYAPDLGRLRDRHAAALKSEEEWKRNADAELDFLSGKHWIDEVTA